MPKFKSTTGTPIQVFVPEQPGPIFVGADEPMETEDANIIRALRDIPTVEEVKGAGKKEGKEK